MSRKGMTSHKNRIVSGERYHVNDFSVLGFLKNSERVLKNKEEIRPRTITKMDIDTNMSNRE
jgi:hypothetical protein